MALVQNKTLQQLQSKRYEKQGSLVSPAKSYVTEEEDEAKKKKGGKALKAVGDFFEGIGYLGHRLGLSAVQTVENSVDWIASSAQMIFGNKSNADKSLKNDWLNYNAADDWYDPSEGWQTAADVASAVGGMGTTALVSLIPYAGPIVSGSMVFADAAGGASKEALSESGNYGKEEFAYSALEGGKELLLEKALGKIFKWGDDLAGAIGSKAASAAAGKAGKEVAETSIKSLLKSAGREVLAETTEEVISEFVSPYIKRATYKPNAENATADELAYVAFVSAISSLVMGGGVEVAKQSAYTIRGSKIDNAGKSSQAINEARAFVDTYGDNKYTSAIKNITDKLAPVVESGQKLNANQRRSLGELRRYQTEALFTPIVTRSAITAISNPEAVAAKLNQDGVYKMVDGKIAAVNDGNFDAKGKEVRDITAEDITRGVEKTAAGTLNKYTVINALAENDVLRLVAASDAAGRIIMNSKEKEIANSLGSNLKNQQELNEFLKSKSPEEKAALSKELGIQNIDDVAFEEFNAKAKDYEKSGKAKVLVETSKTVDKMKEIPESEQKSMPKEIDLPDGGTARFTDGESSIGVYRRGDEYIIYDFVTNKTYKPMTKARLDSLLRSRREAINARGEIDQAIAGRSTKGQNQSEADIATEADSKASPSDVAQRAAREVEARSKAETIAKDKINGYSEIDDAKKTKTRSVIENALKAGISEKDATSYARVSARTGLDIVFDKEACRNGNTYYAGYYDPDNNRIVVNPETTKSHAALLIHELSHAIRSYRSKDNKIHYIADKNAKITPELWQKVKKYYADQNVNVNRMDLYLDEASAYYAEEILGTDAALDLLLGKKKTLKEKILSFFRGAIKRYSDDEGLSREARKFYRSFKKMFDAFEVKNQLAAQNAENASEDGRRYSFSSIAYTFFGDENMSSSEFSSRDYKNSQGYKNYVEQCVANMKQSHKEMTEAAIRKEVEASIDGIVKVAIAMKKAGYDIHDTNAKRGAKDTKNRLLFSSLEPNSDYFTSSDISTICDKRKNFAEIYDDIVREEEKLGVPEGKRFFNNVDNYFYIHDVLAKKGLTQPCRECYVESMRKNLAPMANAFLELIRETDEGNVKNKQLYDKGKPKSGNAEKRTRVLSLLNEYGKSAKDITVEMLSTEDGLAQMKLQMPELYEIFNSFYGQSKPKMPKGATPFRFGELTALLTDEHGKIKTKLVKQIESTGGFRLQSYSDFQIQNYTDVLQVMFEAGTLGLTGHAYTKVPAFLDATKGTNLKRNISVFMYKDGNNWRVDRNDSFPYSLHEMYKLVKDDKSGNTGIIVVSQNADNSAWIMANDLIAYGIPFHKSGLKMGVVRDTIVREDGREIAGYKNIKDHTKQQSEVYAKTEGDHKALTKVKKGINIYEFWDFENKSGLSKNELIKKNLKEYINRCEKAGYLPKFREYVMNNKDVLNATLEYAKELGSVASNATISDISFSYKGYQIPYGYYKFLGDFSMFNADGKASPHDVLSLAKYDFDEAVNYFSDPEQIRRKEILQQFANGKERAEYAESTLNSEELSNIVDGKRKEVVNEIVYKANPKRSANSRASVEDINKPAQRMVDEGKKNPDIRYSIDEDITESPTLGNVAKSRFDKPKPKLKEKIKAGFTSAKDKLYIETVDELYGVEKYLKKFGGRKDAEAFVQQVRASETIAQTMIGNVQYDIVSGDGTKLGEGISKIFKPYKIRKIENQFNDYLLHHLNVDRMTLRERTNGEVDNKPVFGKNEKRDHDITAEESKKIIAAYEKKYSSFKADAEKVWSYSKNLLNMRVKAGLVSQEAADLMNKYYPHYVPSFREDVKSVGSSAVKNDSQFGVNSTIKKAKGGSADIYSIEESIAAQTRQAIKAMELNKMANAVYDAAIKSGDDSYVIAEEVETETNTDPDTDTIVDLVPKNNQIVFFKDGKRIEMSVAKEIFDGFKGVTSGSVPDMFITRMANRGVKAFKNLVTSYSPAFSVRNFVRDLQDAGINSKHSALWAKNIPLAIGGIASNDALWQQYLAHGGYASTVFDGKGFTNGIGGRGFEALQKISEIDGNSFKKLSAAMKNILVSVGNANAFVEQVTRFAEFRASIEAGDSIQTAINNSADVTTNFSRHGKSVKVLNATFIPFLNASVQGFDKLLRVITGPFKEKSLAAIAILLAKALAIGIAPQILNMVMNGDDEEYYDLTDEVRENYFLIKVGDQFIKIPRGRAAAAFGGIANRIGNEMRGDDFDVGGYLTSLKDNVTPVDSFSRNILSPFKDLATNTTWYGGEIEGRQFDNVRPSQRYDESTSSIAIWVGDKINYSPKKIHYLMDQYSGVIGDFLLPATTKKAEKDYLSANFLIDSTTNNKLSSDFYRLYDEAMYATEEGDMIAYYQLRHLNDVKESVSKLYEEINEIQSSDLKNAEKLQQVRTLRVLINNIYRTAAVDYAAYTQAIKATDGMFDDSDDSGKRDRHVAITQMMYGSEKALEEYNKNVYEKSALFNKAGISYDTYYEYYFGVRDIESDVDKNGEVVSGSKKKEVEAAIKSMGVDSRTRALLLMASGYSVTESEKRSIASYIRSLDLTDEEFKELAEACGFKVKNGRIQL